MELNACKRCRRARVKLFLKGERCLSPKCSVTLRNYPPGQKASRPKKISEYGLQLLEKQKIKATYGIRERQLSFYYKKASKFKQLKGEKLLQILEMRLDNVIYRCGFTSSRASARQLILHGHVKINNKKVDLPSYQAKPKDKIEISLKIQPLKIELPSWLKRNVKALTANVINVPERKEIATDVDELKILEFYAR
ncbi:MAG: 30S ribosomal protein S4 [Candidatus Nealsonbacteria bacterium CG23_combo_of_CG06-09_8_20_14_all_40_13]|uniref:Small ribosomal subunit protein uS4 n=1 Tax=Candidatus Nealsonbacteria bacterium CG23_combo_of_CG06-09_8_20_14_all_40_13 TaxID=1974724 RepID=A0A2G9YQZ7_9BACT|nr:MAG: 30S ribosomal protein S4 [Candidatus Nealsonbacteria bacterium CG23_combo_of_CG06-09_8_20_14_all_40_13]PIR71237.1 MAG: 30S ribosomal protein S4 [Candidatus Nealsonbacteria bacterium CG10_big_fil_rev_8_21_14_0_10_40_24]PIU43322.1 MAG: 30S ribosomal protein S4 [Candidatus Nealsonbacteria bacterium CG07_land_8_20_14_0_80_40_10]